MGKHKVNILMVDDQPGKLLSYEVILGELDENLIKASSGREALEHLLRIDVAVVLLDVSMPGMDGFELADLIRAHPRFQKTAIIFISAVHLSDLDRLKAYERGAVDYISVPIIPELLRAKVTVFAELHRKTQELKELNHQLEQRVEERTLELENKAISLEQLNSELAQKNQELDAIITTAPDIIFSRNPDGPRDYISERFYEYTGAAPGSAQGMGWLEYVHPEDRERSLEEWMRCVRSGDTYESEYRLRGRDGKYRWFRARAIPIRERSQIVRWYGTCSDVDDSKLLEQAMRESAIRLEKMVDERTAELRHLSARLMTMQDEERRRIAREIHDGLGQELVAAKIVTDGIQHVPSGQLAKQAALEASDLIDRALQQVRTMSYLLHPPLLDEVGLLSTVRWYIDGLRKRSGIDITLETQPDEFLRLPGELETAIFRMLQEALTNVYRHSGAQQATVTLVQNHSLLTLRVRDNGRGIQDTVAQLRPDSIGIGIGGMRQRTRDLGGNFHITNADPGTLIEIVVPYVLASSASLPGLRA